mmetsp:Transcript_51266/g.128632  ORF Transcript_51266/g.128632 Transcript_51266/m.128632 type:complete len:275 (-) Transcript_51266:1380-2204(-)
MVSASGRGSTSLPCTGDGASSAPHDLLPNCAYCAWWPLGASMGDVGVQRGGGCNFNSALFCGEAALGVATLTVAAVAVLSLMLTLTIEPVGDFCDGVLCTSLSLHCLLTDLDDLCDPLLGRGDLCDPLLGRGDFWDPLPGRGDLCDPLWRLGDLECVGSEARLLPGLGDLCPTDGLGDSEGMAACGLATSRAGKDGGCRCAGVARSAGGGRSSRGEDSASDDVRNSVTSTVRYMDDTRHEEMFSRLLTTPSCLPRGVPPARKYAMMLITLPDAM